MSEERFWTMELNECNKKDLLNWLNEDRMEGLVDEECGGIIGYLNRNHIGKVIKKLNRGETKTQKLIKELKKLTDDERRDIINNFCDHCGCIQPEDGPGCQCWNDE